ncbi:hypothetical protein H0H87_005227 [Tephrocybe sp. NHM501043]|nr:hypothetical protein H0H87_005227 [Tephrocybe sp. NHM501043]
MSSKTAPKLQLGKRIDGDTLEFVEVLGVGGYGVVYRAVDVTSHERQSYAVKCLLHAKDLRPARKQFHIREIALHQISSAHPGIVTLHRIIEDHQYTYIIMDYAPDHDLFTQILNHCRYLGNDVLIKHVFLQLVDAVEYCHSLGIYHRDLKPENILCFDDGCTVAITDFGLATTEKVSDELHTGSIYHMSPGEYLRRLSRVSVLTATIECQGGAFAPEGRYSPKSNDVWSLGIILLNLATGRNPWKTATIDDLTFQAYLREPLTFFPSVLPVSQEINDILLQMLHVDWQQRVTLPELRQQMEDISNFYAPDVVFDGSQARCSWEATDSLKPPPVPEKELPRTSQGLTSYWSEDSLVIDFEQKKHDTPPCSLLSPQVSGFPIERKAKPDVSADAIVESQSSSASSSSSHLSFSTSPTTPGTNERTFGNSGLVEINMEDVFERAMPHEGQEFTEGMMSTMSSSLFLKVPRPSVDIHDPEGDNPWDSSEDSNEAVSSWATLPLKSPSPISKDSTFGSNFRKTRPPTPPLDRITWAPAPSHYEREPPCNSDKALFNPMRLFFRPSRSPSHTSKDPSPLPGKPTAQVEPISRKSGGGEKDVETNDGRWRLGKFGRRSWFSPTKLFVSAVTS